MTGGAITAQRPVMRVDFVVATDAGVGSLAVRHVSRVTTAAGQGEVCVSQRKVRKIMRETGLIEPRDVGLASVVLRVTTAALARAGLWHSSVVAGLTANVFRHVFVTVETEGGLPRPIGSVVTIGALAFDFRVCLRDRAGHDQLLEGSGARPVTG